MKYMVMECHPGYAVLLDEEGRFLKAANLHYEVGQTVYDPVLVKDGTKKQRRMVRRFSSGFAAIAASFLLFFGFRYYQDYLQPYSSIYLNINPEVRMDLNRQGTVVELTGTNEDGETLLEGYNGKGKDKVTVSDELIDRAIDMGYLSEGGKVTFSINAPDNLLFQEYETDLHTEVTEHLDGRITVEIEIFSYQNESVEKPPENSTPAEISGPDETSAGSPPPESVWPVAAPSDGNSDYDDTDYGSDNAGAYIPPASSGQAGSNTDYDDSDYNDDGSDYNQGDDDDGDDD